MIAPTPVAPKARCRLSIPTLLVCFVVNIVWLGNEPAFCALIPTSEMRIPIDAEAVSVDKNSYDVELHRGIIIVGHDGLKTPAPDSSGPHLTLQHFMGVG